LCHEITGPTTRGHCGVVLITGGLGGLGLVTAEAFAELGAECVVLVSRSGTIKHDGQGLEARLSKLQATATRVVIERADVSEEASVESLLSKVREEQGQLDVVVHAAASWANGLLSTQDAAKLRSVFEPKVDGARWLHQHTSKDELQGFVLFSSIASLFGGVGQANYAAANAFLDGLALRRRAQGLAGVSIQWPAIADVGMAAALDSRVAIDRSLSVDEHVVKQVLKQLALKDTGEAVQAVVPRAMLVRGVLPPVLSSFVVAVEVAPAVPRQSTEKKKRRGRRRRVAASSSLPAQSSKETTAAVTRAVRGLLGEEVSGEIEVEAPLMEMGLDSLAATELVRELSEEFGLQLPPTLLFDYPTITALAEHLQSQLQIGAAPTEYSSDDENVSVQKESKEETLNNDWALIKSDCLLSFGQVQEQKVSNTTHNAKEIFVVTGATGAVGGVIVLELLHRNESCLVVCLVRGGDHSRLMTHLEKVRGGVLLLGQRRRVFCISGDITDINLGLGSDATLSITECCHSSGKDVSIKFVHCAAMVHHLQTYSFLRETNVIGTLNVIRVVEMTRHAPCVVATELHYVSTFNPDSDLSNLLKTIEFLATLDENENNNPSNYALTKYVAEHLIWKYASESGAAVNVFRPGNMWGHSQSGFVLPGDTTTRLLISAGKCGSISLSRSIDVAPLDWSGAAIVEIIISQDRTSKLWFPMPSDTCMPMHSILRGLQGAGVNAGVHLGTWGNWTALKMIQHSPVAPLLHEIVGGVSRFDVTFRDKLFNVLFKARHPMPVSRVTAHHVTLAARYLKLRQVIEGMRLIGLAPTLAGVSNRPHFESKSASMLEIGIFATKYAFNSQSVARRFLRVDRDKQVIGWSKKAEKMTTKIKLSDITAIFYGRKTPTLIFRTGRELGHRAFSFRTLERTYDFVAEDSRTAITFIFGLQQHTQCRRKYHSPGQLLWMMASLRVDAEVVRREATGVLTSKRTPKSRRNENGVFMAEEKLLNKDLSGKVCLVTGGNSGIGKSTVAQLAKQGATVVLACRRVDDGERLAATLGHLPGSVHIMRLDLADLLSVRKFAETFLASHDTLHCLVNNAGIMNVPRSKTVDGFDMQLGVNHLGHFLLTELLLPVLKQSAPSRVVTLSSIAHNDEQGHTGHIHIDFEDLHFERRPYNGWAAYAQSKLANLLHSRELARRLEGSGVTAYSVHPGGVFSNLLNHTLTSAWKRKAAMPFLRAQGYLQPWEGVQTSLKVILGDDLVNGGYYAQSGGGDKGGWPRTPQNPEALDDAVAARLWDVSHALVSQP